MAKPELLLRNLDFINAQKIAELIASIPSEFTSLNLSLNYLGNKTGAELAQAFAAIPPGVTSLNLRHNDLGNKTGAELAQAFAAIPPGVTSLNLSLNYLGNKTGAELAQAFAAILPGVTSLDLSSNRLRDMTDEDLAQTFAAIPPGVTSLDLSDYVFEFPGLTEFIRFTRTGAYLERAFKAIPVPVNAIGLSSKELEDLLKEKSIHGFLAFFENFQNSVKSLMVDDKIYTPPSAYLFSMPESRFKTFYEDNVLSEEAEEVDDAIITSYQSIKPLVTIDENTLFELIELLEKNPTPQTDFICALLLEGRIENVVDEEKMEQMDYIMQRRLYALDFYQRAAYHADGTFADQIEKIMMLVKNTEPKDSPIYEKLSKFIFTPEKEFQEGSEKKPFFIEKSDTPPSIDLSGLRTLLDAKSGSPGVAAV